MDISFVIPTYNAASHIVATIDQLKAVRHLHYEVIVSDNGSNDKTRELALAAGAKIKSLPTDVRSSNSECCNRGAALATAEVVWFIDATVRLLELEAFADEVVEYFRHHSNTVAMLPRSRMYRETAAGSGKFWYAYVNLMNLMQSRIFKTGATPAGCIIVRRSAFEKIHGYNPTLSLAEGSDLLRRLARLGEVQIFWHRLAELPARRSARAVSRFLPRQLGDQTVWLR